MERRGKTHHPAGVVQQRPAFIGAVHQAQAISLRWVCRILHHRIFQPQPRLCIGEQRAALALANRDQEIQIASHVSQRRRHRAGRQIGIHPRRRCQRHAGQHRPIGPQGAVTGRIAAAIAPLDGAARVGHAQRLAHTFFDDLFHRLAFDARQRLADQIITGVAIAPALAGVETAPQFLAQRRREIRQAGGVIKQATDGEGPAR